MIFDPISTMDTSLDDLLHRHFAGRVVRKDLTKLVKEGANVPVYVLEYLLGTYCASNDDEVIQEGLTTVKRILAENYVRPDEAEKVKSIIRERGSYKIIDKVTVPRTSAPRPNPASTTCISMSLNCITPAQPPN
jgi:ATP-dependent Lon protease